MKTNHRSHFHIKKIAQTPSESIWIVDGERVRKELNENFVQSGHHARFPFIPSDEFWIDMNTDLREWKLFIDRHIAERVLSISPLSQKERIRIADNFERQERKALLNKETKCPPKNTSHLLKRIRKTLLFPEKTSEALRIWKVDGKLVRDFLFLGYDAGGHDLVYPWIPEGEIWLEEALSQKAQKFILLHELHERALMAQGKRYREAHQGATLVEDWFRDHADGLDERIWKEYKQNLGTHTKASSKIV